MSLRNNCLKFKTSGAITNHLEGVYRIYPDVRKKTKRCQHVGVGNATILTDDAQISPQTQLQVFDCLIPQQSASPDIDPHLASSP